MNLTSCRRTEKRRREGRRGRGGDRREEEGAGPSPKDCSFLHPPLSFKIRELQFWPPFPPSLQAARSHRWTPMRMETAEGSGSGPRACRPAGGAADLRALASGAQREKPEPSPGMLTEGPYPRGLGLPACWRESQHHCTLGDQQGAELTRSLKRGYRKLGKTHLTTATWLMRPHGRGFTY